MAKAQKSKLKLSTEHFAPFTKAKADLDALIRKEGEKAVRAFFIEFFEKRPDVFAVRWTQYTPHFNDGEPCVFGLHGIYVFPTQEASEDKENEYNFDCWGEEPETSLNKIEEILESVFGDHAEVTVTREKITSEEYEHD
jgi:hypothetical protein